MIAPLFKISAFYHFAKILPQLSWKYALYPQGNLMMRLTARIFKYPVIFVAGWLFNFMFDAQFVSGFMSGWLGHTWIGNYLF